MRIIVALLLLSVVSVFAATALVEAPPAFHLKWGSYGSGGGEFIYPFGVATDAAGNVYVADTNNHRIQKFTSAGTYLTQWGSPGSESGQFSYPDGVATDAAGNVYVADTFRHRIQKFGERPVQVESITWGRMKTERR